MMTDEEFEKPEARVMLGDESWHSGAGWYYVDDEYPDEGSCGAFATRDEAVEHLREAGYRELEHGTLPTVAEKGAAA